MTGNKVFKILRWISLFAGWVALALATSAAARTAAPTNLIELHAHAEKYSNKQCLACHARIATGVSLDKKIKTYHRLHLESKLDTPKKCADCHQSVDLRNGSAAALRRQVDPQICVGCHSGGMKGAKVLFAQ